MAENQDLRDARYREAAAEFGAALARLARAYEADPDQRRDLLQDIHLELWRSFGGFGGQCSMRTWVYRVAHNVGISRRVRKRKLRLVTLEEVADLPATDRDDLAANESGNVMRLYALIRQLIPPDDLVMLLYLEDMSAADIGEITGLSARAVAIRVHRTKAILARQLRPGGSND
ncbi:MAG TPA: sigma-70 family RNA polymerase sigma factor [Burkholderiales bacterium]|nr:sigma-70 family RNA polymerase sigma factor [Burkholderiales bacterium]